MITVEKSKYSLIDKRTNGLGITTKDLARKYVQTSYFPAPRGEIESYIVPIVNHGV